MIYALSKGTANATRCALTFTDAFFHFRLVLTHLLNNVEYLHARVQKLGLRFLDMLLLLGRPSLNLFSTVRISCRRYFLFVVELIQLFAFLAELLLELRLH